MKLLIICNAQSILNAPMKFEYGQDEEKIKSTRGWPMDAMAFWACYEAFGRHKAPRLIIGHGKSRGLINFGEGTH